jgi:membrane protease YdiL (CAAX protease family)
MTMPCETRSVGRALALSLLFPALVIPGQVVAAKLLAPESLFDAPHGVFPLAFIMLAVHALVLAGVFLKIGNTSLFELGWRSDRFVRDVLRGMVGFVGVVGLIFVIAVASGSLRELVVSIAGFTMRQRVLFLLIGLDAAMVEETIFRGCVQPALSTRLGPLGGLLVAAAVHALWHFQFQPWRLASLVAISAVYGLARSKDGSIVGSGVAHFLTWAVVGAA